MRDRVNLNAELANAVRAREPLVFAYHARPSMTACYLSLLALTTKFRESLGHNLIRREQN